MLHWLAVLASGSGSSGSSGTQRYPSSRTAWMAADGGGQGPLCGAERHTGTAARRGAAASGPKSDLTQFVAEAPAAPAALPSQPASPSLNTYMFMRKHSWQR